MFLAAGSTGNAAAGESRSGLKENLLSLLRIPSITSSVEENNRAVGVLKVWLDARGVFTAVETNDAGRAALYASAIPGKRHDVVFVTHLDVVPPLKDGQFEPKERDGFVWGRGACDTKGNVAVVAQVLANLSGKASVGAVFATDEETRVPGQATPAMLLERGYVPQKLVLVGDTNGEHSDALAIAEKGHVLVTIRAHGRGGHSSMPQSADNPIPKLLDACAKIRAFVPDPQSPGDAWRDDLVPTRLAGSNAGNTIPDTAEAVFSFRFTTPEAPLRLKERIECETGLEVLLPAKWREPVLTDPENPWIRRLHAAMHERWPRKDVRLVKMSCATDATHYVHLGIPVAIFAANGEGAHSADERVSLGSCEEYAAMFTEFLQAKEARPARFAVYAGDGARGVGVFRWLELTACAENVEATPVDAAAIRGGALDGMDALVVPGGRSVLMAKSLGEEGTARIRAFVAHGGGYVGTCAGCCLAMEPAECRPGMAGLIPFTFGEAGGGKDIADVMVHFNSRAEALVGVPKGDVRIQYRGGPVPLPSLPVTNGEFEVVATYAGDINGRSSKRRPSMAGQAAAVAGTYGEGRVFATAVHPEYDAADHDVLRGALRYVVRRGDINWELPQRRRGQLAVGVMCAGSFNVEAARLVQSLVRSGEFDLVPLVSASVDEGACRHLDAALSLDGSAVGELPTFPLDEDVVAALRGFSKPVPPPVPFPAKVAKPLRAAIYADKGGSNPATAELLALAPEYDLSVVDAADIRAGRLDGFDLLVQPSGLSKVQYDNLGKEGAAAICRYVRGGGRYFGICAGAFLASQPVPPTDRGLSRLNLVPFRSDEPEHYRGWAPIDVAFTDEGCAALGIAGVNRTVMYWGGPAFEEGDPVEDADIKVFGRYAGRLVNTSSPGSVKEMYGKTAFVGGRVGKGKVFLSCPHPEKSEANMDIVRGAVRYLTGVEPTPVRRGRTRGAVSVFFRAAKEKAAAEFYLGTLLRDSRLDIRAGSHLNVDDLAHLDAVVIPAPGEDDRKDAPFLRRFAERGGTVVYVVDTEEKRQTDAVRVPGAAVVGSYGEVVKAIFNAEEDK